MHAGIIIKQMQQRDLNDSSQALRQAEQITISKVYHSIKEQVQLYHKTE